MNPPVTTRQGRHSSSDGGQRSIKVLYIIGGLPLGGAENQVFTLASALNGDRYRVYVCCLRRAGLQADALRARGIPLYVLNMRLRFWPIAMFRLYRLIRQLKPQIVHTHLYEADMWGRLAAWLAGVPVILTTIHGRLYWRKRVPGLFFDRLLNNFTDKIITVSEEIRQSFLGQQGVSEEKIVTIPNAVDLQRFRGPHRRDEHRIQFGVDGTSPLIGIVARLTPEKRVDDFLRGAQIVRETAPQARFVIIGDGPLRAELERRAMKLGLIPTFVRFLGSRLDIPDLLSALDIFVLCSESEGLPVSMLEAMAAGKAVVVTGVGGIPRVITDGQNGIIVPPCDPSGLAKAILALVGNSTLRESVAVRGYRTVEACYSTQVVGHWIGALYDELIVNKGAGRVH